MFPHGEIIRIRQVLRRSHWAFFYVKANVQTAKKYYEALPFSKLTHFLIWEVGHLTQQIDSCVNTHILGTS